MSQEEKENYAKTFVSNKEVEAHIAKAFRLENILKNETIR